ncbi:transcription factor TFIIIB component B'' [Coccinella septempunctata]|uniref:transcription factor TFIIIB component B'' n=1 Tax=Coccinella septempunctata TaxID=41139 RepID=UPI001D0843EC|nr:transcription factor TFIIIB component B'' [Coccinella septempunctata]
MRRAKVKATICVKRKKTDSSAALSTSSDPTVDIPLSTDPTPQASPKSPTEDPIISPTENCVSSASTPSPIKSTQPAFSEVEAPPSTPMSQVDSIVTESHDEKSKPAVKSSVLTRTKIKAVPKIRGRKVGSGGTPSENEIKKSDIVSTQSTSIEEPANSPCVQESTDDPPLKSSQSEIVNSQSNPIPPASPSKICRTKIKAVPILGHRRIHSASDSDDGNKNSSTRIRTDSQSSCISGNQDTIVEQPQTPKKNESNSETKRKFKKSEGSKKLADARREFAKKYVDGKPDYKKLTMMDLIFYNPTTNPMRSEKKKSVSSTKSVSINEQNEEEVDNPTEPTDEDPTKKDEEQLDKSEDEEDIIAPRIKIGPTGEIILDEKSLVIENKKTKKALEEMEKTEAVDEDLDRPYGVYKRFKRCKWSHSDTLKFYRALSTVGTDFSLMTELFSNRTRRELKLKFKKEERINQALVDQAIMKPCSFNFNELKSEFELMEIERLEIEQQQIKSKEMSEKKLNKKTNKLSKIMQEDDSTTNSTESIQENSSEKNSNSSEAAGEKPVKKKREKKRKPTLLKPPKPSKKLDILSALSDSENSEIDSDEESEEAFSLNTTHTTRYGRKTKRREIYEPNINLEEEELIIQKKIRKPNPEPEPAQKPGSLMVVSSETSDGQPVVQIFMVTNDNAESTNQNDTNAKNLLPIAMIRTNQANEEEEEVVENNYTIPADTGENENDSIEIQDDVTSQESGL